MSFTAASNSNVEEAQYIASEYFQSLDNLPHEVQHILEEIRHKDYRAQELQQDIQKDQQKYVKSCLKSSSNHSSATASAAPGAAQSPGLATSVPQLNPKSSLIPDKISAAFAEIDQLCEQKIQLAERLQELLVRTTMRLEADLKKVRILQGESPDEPASRAVNAAYEKSMGIIKQVEASIQDEIMSDASSSVSAVRSQRPVRKSNSTAANAIKLPSPAPSPVAATAPPPPARERSSRPSRSRLRDEDIDMTDLDAEAEPEEEDVEDNTLYCFCQHPSYGDMIGCDNPTCEFQWFHMTCLGGDVQSDASDKWYCPSCVPKIAAAAQASTSRKRKR